MCCEKEKQEMKDFISDLVDKLSDDNRRRAADILLGVVVAENLDQNKKPEPIKR